MREQPGPRIEALCGAYACNDRVLVCMPPRLAGCWKCVMLHVGRPLPAEPKTPEHERLEQAKKTDDATQLVGEFMDWLADAKKLVLGRWNDDDELIPARENIQRLLAEYFGISQAALESEKQALLEYMRAVNKAREWVKEEGIPFLRGK